MKNILNKEMIKIVLPLFLMLGFSACSGGGGGDSTSTTTTPEDNTVQTLIEGDSIDVKKGDSIEPLSEDTEITVEHIINTENKTVTIKKGSAEFIAGSYDLE